MGSTVRPAARRPASRLRSQHAHGAVGDWHRHRRIHAHPSRLERHYRVEGLDRPDRHVRRSAAQPDAGLARADHGDIEDTALL